MGKLDRLASAVERNNELLVEQNRLLRELLSGRAEKLVSSYGRGAYVPEPKGVNRGPQPEFVLPLGPHESISYQTYRRNRGLGTPMHRPELAVIEGEPHCRDDTNSYGDAG